MLLNSPESYASRLLPSPFTKSAVRSARAWMVVVGLMQAPVVKMLPSRDGPSKPRMGGPPRLNWLVRPVKWPWGRKSLAKERRRGNDQPGILVTDVRPER